MGVGVPKYNSTVTLMIADLLRDLALVRLYSILEKPPDMEKAKPTWEGEVDEHFGRSPWFRSPGL